MLRFCLTMSDLSGALTWSRETAKIGLWNMAFQTEGRPVR